MKVTTSSPEVAGWLRSHPGVSSVESSEHTSAWLTFGNRSILKAPAPLVELGGLPELMDNNPLVCADRIWLPSPAGTLSLIALGPLISAGLLVEDPVIITNFGSEEDEIIEALATEQWHSGVTLQPEDHPHETGRGIYALAKLETPPDLEELDELYRERFSRSLYVREADEAEWDWKLVLNQHFAAYRLEISVGDPHSILAIHAMADLNGKLGASQAIHAFNIMNGFEESLGLAQ